MDVSRSWVGLTHVVSGALARGVWICVLRVAAEAFMDERREKSVVLDDCTFLCAGGSTIGWMVPVHVW